MSRRFGSTRSVLFTLALALVTATVAACGSDDDGGLDGPSDPGAGSGGDDVTANKGGSTARGGSPAKGGTGGVGGSGAEAGSGGEAGEGGDGGTAGAGGKSGSAGKSGAGGSAGKSGAGGSAGKSGAGGGAGNSGAGGSAGKAGAGGGAGTSAGTGGKAGNGTAGASGSSGAPTHETCAVGSTGIRVMAANLTSGNKQQYEAPGIRIMQAVKPDVVLIQEFTPASGTVDNLVDQICDGACTFHRGATANGGSIPNGVISRFPILAAGTWLDAATTNRQFEWARIDLPGSRDMLAISVHLLTTDGSRPAQTAALVEYIKANALPTDYVVLGGDFNTSSYEDPAFATFSAVLSVAAPYPADQTGNVGTNTNRLMEGKSKPYDHVVANDLLRDFETAVVIGASSFPAGVIIDTRVHAPIEAIAPALATDSGAINMQHMGVVRAYCLPNE